jgi:two-component system sensor histidine kinase BaeS
VAIGAGLVVAGRLSSPLRKLAEAARGIAAGGSAPPPPARGSPEIRDLGEALEGLAADLERQQRARRQLAQDLSHELRTPLMLLQGRIEAMQDGVIPFDAEGLAALHTETLRLSRLIGQIERLAEAEAHPAPLRLEEVALDVLAREARDALAAAFEMRGLALELIVRPTPAAGDRDAVRQIVTNLLSNALKYAPDGAPVRLATSPEGRTATLRVHDGGRAVAGSERQRLFERFYRGQGAAERSGGAGLGLTIARQLAEEQGGSLELETNGAGTCFVLRLPASLTGSVASPAHALSAAQTPPRM